MYTSHTPWANNMPVNEVIDMAGELGLDRVVCGFGPDDYKDMDSIKRTADKVNSILPELKKAGLMLFQHNHDFEFQMLDGRLKYDIYAEMVPDVKFQLDAFWSSNFGANDPAEMIKRYADRIVSLHIKDGTFEQDPAKVEIVNGYPDRKLKLFPLGEGQMDIPAIIAAAPANVDNVIVELDYCEVEMKEALRRSYTYMTSSGFAAGNK
jgi:sugar phosphate isomerase/epimerase